MNQRFTGEEKVGAIVSEYPGASNVFKEIKIDFCCGGDISLIEAARKKNLDVQEVLSRLNAGFADMKARAEAGEKDWRVVKTDDLIEHIIMTHHNYLRKELPFLSETVTKILRVHGEAHPELSDLYKQFHQMKMEMDAHLIMEEEILFPLLKNYALNPSDELHAQAMKKLYEMESEHSAVGDLLTAMRATTNDFTLPEGACGTYTITFRKLEELESDIFQHVHLENNILFPRIESKQVFE